MLRLNTSRGAPGVALVLVDGVRVGSVRKFGPKDWRAKTDHEPEYPERGFPTRAEAAAKVEKLANFEWKYDQLVEGGERWRLQQYGVSRGCVVRFPVSMSRLYSGDTVEDFPNPKLATEALAAMFGVTERAPCV